MDAYTDRVDMSRNPVFGLRNGDFNKIFLSNGNIFEVDFYHGFKILNDNRIHAYKYPDVISFWCCEINGKKLDRPVQIVTSVDQIVAVETMNSEPEDD